MLRRIFSSVILSVFLLPGLAAAQDAKPAKAEPSAKPKPKVIVVGVNGMELDIIRPLLLKGQMPNLASVVNRGAYGKLRTVRWDRFGRPENLPEYGGGAFPTIWWWDAERAARVGSR